MKRIMMVASILGVIIFSANVFAEAESAPGVSAREPLTFRDMGIYAWWYPYFWEGPFDFLIVQAIIAGPDHKLKYDRVSDSENLKLWNKNLMKARAAGKRVIADIQYTAAEDYFYAIDTFLTNVNVDELYAITIGEEHVFWDGKHQILTDLYYQIKEKYPDLPVYQWYTPTSRARDVPGFSWPLLPADGWMIDEYMAMPADFENAIRRYRMLGVPLVHIVWAAPAMSASGATSVPYYRGVFDGQLRIAKKYNVPCAFFSWDGPPQRTWAWNEKGSEANKKLFKVVLKEMEQAGKVPEKDLIDWEASYTPRATILEKRNDGNLSYRESFDLRMKVSGEKLPEHDFMKRSRIKGLRNMKWAQDPTRIVISSDGAKPIDTSITNQWRTPDGERCRFIASAKIEIDPKASGDVIFEVSTNGYDWIAKTIKIKDGLLQVNVPTINTELYTRLRIAGKIAKAGAPLAAIDWIEVRGTITK